MNNKKLSIILIIIIILVYGRLIFKWKNYKIALTFASVSILTDKKEYEEKGILKLKIKNNSLKKICFSTCYPYYLEGKNSNWESYEYEECRGFNGNGHCLEPKREKAFELTLPNIQEGIYRLAIPVCSNCKDEQAFQEEKDSIQMNL